MIFGKKEAFVAMSIATASLILTSVVLYVSAQTAKRSEMALSMAEKAADSGKRNEAALSLLKREISDMKERTKRIKKALAMMYDIANQSGNSELKGMERTRRLVLDLNHRVGELGAEIDKMKTSAAKREEEMEKLREEIEKTAEKMNEAIDSKIETSAQEYAKLRDDVEKKMAELKKKFFVIDAMKGNRDERIEGLRRSISALEKRVEELLVKRPKEKKEKANGALPFEYGGLVPGKKDRGYIISPKSGRRFELGVGTVINGRWKVRALSEKSMKLFDKKTNETFSVEKSDG